MTRSVDVIVIGAGPTGAMLAALLGQSGVRVLLADRATEIYPLPRAAHIDHETLRIFQQAGVADEIMATSRPAEQYDFLTADGQVLMRFLSQGSPSGWPASNMIHQPSVEAALRHRIAALESVDLRVSWELLDYQADGPGIEARFQTPEGEQRIAARYLVGCDGAASRVRILCGTALEDLQFDEPWLVIDTLVLDPARLPDINLQICDPARPTTCVMMGSGRHRWEFMLKPDETVTQALDDSFIADLLAPWKVEGAVTLERKAVYRFHALVADGWRKGPVFLAGDAAHQMPPFAGQGMCSGVRDAANLAWKMTAVLRGEAGDALLDTYESERRPHVTAIINLALMMGRTVCILDPVAAAQRDAALLAQRAAAPPDVAGQGMAFPPLEGPCVLVGSPAAGEPFIQPWAGAQRWDDVAGDGSWLITREAVPATPGLRVLYLADPALGDFAAPLEAWLSRRGAAAALVRPDRVVFGTGAPDDLVRAWACSLR
jgi:3-(3-hydroxy-phenyl)propionate hydroxylase